MDTHKVNKIVNRINLLSALFLVTQLPFYYAKPQYYATLIFFISYVLEFFLDKKWRTFNFDLKQWGFISMAAYFVVQLLYYPFETDLAFFKKILEQRLPFIAFAIVGLFGVNQFYKLRYFAYTFIGTSIIVISYLVFTKIGISEFLHNETRSELFAATRIQYVHGHMIFNSFLNVALIFVFYLVFILKKYPSSRILNPVALICGGIIYGILFISEGRTGFLVANLMVLMMAFYKFWKWKKQWAILISLIALAGLIIVVMHHPRMNQEKLNKESRFAIWNVAKKVISDKPYTGYGASTAASVFMNKGANDPEFIAVGDFYLLKMMNERNILGGNPHNIFLKSILEYGILGVILILCLFIVPLIFVDKQLRFCLGLFIFSVMFQLQFEIFVSGILTIMFALVITIFLRSSKEDFSQDILSEAKTSSKTFLDK